jgi:hypothetical protein
MGRLPHYRSFEARSSCLRVVVLPVVFIVFIIIVIIIEHQRRLVFSSFQHTINSLLSTKKIHSLHLHAGPPTRTFHFGIPTEYPTNHFRQCLLPPPQTLLRALRQLSPRRKSRSARRRSRRRGPGKMTTTRTRILMIPKAKGKRLAPRAKNTMLHQSHTLLRRNMPKTQAASRRQMQACAQFWPQNGKTQVLTDFAGKHPHKDGNKEHKTAAAATTGAHNTAGEFIPTLSLS